MSPHLEEVDTTSMVETAASSVVPAVTEDSAIPENSENSENSEITATAVAVEGPAAQEASARPVPTAPPAATDTPVSPLPFTGAPAETDARYLATLMAVAATDARAYKDLSYQLLDVHEGMRVLDVGCGIGVDLPYLSAAVGPTGAVIGLDRNADLVERAKQYLLESSGVPGVTAATTATTATTATGIGANVQVLPGAAESIPLPDSSIDRVRTDRAMQHFSDPARAIAEIWRVLKPGGVTTLVEPDWGMMAIHPGSVAGGDDDTTFSHVHVALRQSVAHPLLGRQLYSLLHELGPSAWSRVQVQIVAFGLTDWGMVDPILELSSTVELLGQDQPALRADLEAWLTALQEAAQAGTFFAAIPLMFATAWKSDA